KSYDRQVAPGIVVVIGDAVVVDHEHRAREILASQTERLEHPIPAAGPAATQRLEIIPPALVILPGRVMQWLVDDFNEIQFWIPVSDRGKPLLDFLALLTWRQALDPLGLLVAPDHDVHLEGESMQL